MSRKFDRPALPPLKQLLKSFRGFSDKDNKRGRSLETLREIVAQVRKPENVAFYSMREVAGALRVPIRTVAIAYQKLESEGILLRIRGSHTQLIGLDYSSHTQIAGAVGLLLSIYAFRHYVYQRAFARQLGDVLWQQSVITDNVLFWDGEDSQSDFAARLLRHHFDAALWFQPLAHNRESMLILRDHGIRTLVITDTELKIGTADIQIQWEDAYRQVLRFWKQNYPFTEIILPEDPRRAPARLRYFEKLANTEGFTCRRFPFGPNLATHLAKPGVLPKKCAIGLFDEMGTVEFCLRDPAAFQTLMARHRILFARDTPSIAFVPPKNLNVECLHFPMGDIMHACSDLLAKWRTGQFENPPIVLQGTASLRHTNPIWM